MKVVIDKHIPYIEGKLESVADVVYAEPEDITPALVSDAEALIIRTRTRCCKQLLEGSSVRFIATATIGFDHIDTEYCRQHSIYWTNCPGCNCDGVCEYVASALLALEQRGAVSLKGATIGVVGVGHVGEKVVQWAERQGMYVLVNDPPKRDQLIASGFHYCELDELASKSDILTFHVPLTSDTPYPTYHLANSRLLDLCRPNAVVINAARGGVLDEQAALQARYSQMTFVIDTWENEPHISTDMLRRAAIGTYHIAGYTRQGKLNATNMCLAALAHYFQLPSFAVTEKVLPLQPLETFTWIEAVDKQLRLKPEYFEQLRSAYPLR